MYVLALCLAARMFRFVCMCGSGINRDSYMRPVRWITFGAFDKSHVYYTCYVLGTGVLCVDLMLSRVRFAMSCFTY